MNKKNKPTLIYCVDDLKKFVIGGRENELYISNRMPPESAILLSNMISRDIQIILFDPQEY